MTDLNQSVKQLSRLDLGGWQQQQKNDIRFLSLSKNMSPFFNWMQKSSHVFTTGTLWCLHDAHRRGSGCDPSKGSEALHAGSFYMVMKSIGPVRAPIRSVWFMCKGLLRGVVAWQPPNEMFELWLLKIATSDLMCLLSSSSLSLSEQKCSSISDSNFDKNVKRSDGVWILASVLTQESWFQKLLYPQRTTNQHKGLGC